MPFKKYSRYTFGLASIILAGVLVCAHFLIFYETNENSLVESPSAPTVSLPDQEQPQAQMPQKILVQNNVLTRKTRLGSKRGLYLTSIFYQGNQVAARQKESGGTAYDREGQIPDGEITFENSADKTFGVEHYENGERHGEYKEYFTTGQLKKEAQYVGGELTQKKEYYPEGILKKEEDYADALRVEGRSQAGVGKIYNKNGQLVYEWRFTVVDQGGFNRSYGEDGQTIEENLFDAEGNVKEKQNEISTLE